MTSCRLYAQYPQQCQWLAGVLREDWRPLGSPEQDVCVLPAWFMTGCLVLLRVLVCFLFWDKQPPVKQQPARVLLVVGKVARRVVVHV